MKQRGVALWVILLAVALVTMVSGFVASTLNSGDTDSVMSQKEVQAYAAALVRAGDGLRNKIAEELNLNPAKPIQQVLSAVPYPPVFIPKGSTGPQTWYAIDGVGSTGGRYLISPRVSDAFCKEINLKTMGSESIPMASGVSDRPNIICMAGLDPEPTSTEGGSEQPSSGSGTPTPPPQSNPSYEIQILGPDVPGSERYGVVFFTGCGGYRTASPEEAALYDPDCANRQNPHYLPLNFMSKADVANFFVDFSNCQLGGYCGDSASYGSACFDNLGPEGQYYKVQEWIRAGRPFENNTSFPNELTVRGWALYAKNTDSTAFEPDIAYTDDPDLAPDPAPAIPGKRVILPNTISFAFFDGSVTAEDGSPAQPGFRALTEFFSANPDTKFFTPGAYGYVLPSPYSHFLNRAGPAWGFGFRSNWTVRRVQQCPDGQYAYWNTSTQAYQCRPISPAPNIAELPECAGYTPEYTPGNGVAATPPAASIEPLPASPGGLIGNRVYFSF